MSQYQSNMPGDLPPGMIPPYASGPYGQPPGRTSGTAIASLVLGILGCIPFVSGLGAIIFGIVGIRVTSRPGVGGRGMAIAGLVLGILSLVCWSGCGGMLGWAFIQTKPDRAIAKSFVTDLSAGNTTAAQSLCTTGVTTQQLDAAVTQVAAYGTLKSVTMFSFNVNSNNGSTSAIVSGQALFANGPHPITVTLTHPPGQSPLIQSFHFQ